MAYSLYHVRTQAPLPRASPPCPAHARAHADALTPHPTAQVQMANAWKERVQKEDLRSEQAAAVSVMLARVRGQPARDARARTRARLLRGRRD